MKKTKIFMSNDDGIEAAGLQMLARELSSIADIVIVAPDRECSSSSSGLTLRQRLYLEKINTGNPAIEAYSFTGKPADCSKFALGYLLRDRMPDLIVSGMNNGYNSGSDVIYSGTVAAALEAIFYDIPALAVSGKNFDREFLERAVAFVREFIEYVFFKKKYEGILNLNIPNIEDIGWEKLKVRPQGLQTYENAISEQKDEEGKVYYRLAGRALPDADDDNDVYRLYRGYLTVTPIQWRQTAENKLDELRNICKKR